ncbi:MAG: glycosyltransferase [Vicinamibacterales bacterium]
MSLLAVWAFWLAVALLVYAYGGFAIVIAAVGALWRRPVQTAPITPKVSLLIAAYNEEAVIAERLENALAMDYPREQLEIIVACDGCTDRTADIAECYADRGVRVLRLARAGKIHALDAAVRQATGEVLAFSDANTMCSKHSMRALVRSFADPGVGGVAGHTTYALEQGSESSSQGENLYWNYDTWLKKLESHTGSVVSAHGGLYAIRRSLYRTVPDSAVTDDFGISTTVIDLGYRLVFEAEARAVEFAVPEARREFRRRVRLMTRGLRGVVMRRRLLNPAVSGFYAVVLFSHKVVRRLAPIALVTALATSLYLAPQGGLYLLAAVAQTFFYALAVAGLLLRRTALGKSKAVYVPFFYCMANVASAIALFELVRGTRIELWQPQRQPDAGTAADGTGTTPGAVVIGLDSITGLQTVRRLAARGIPVTAFAANRSHPSCRTNSCERIVFAKTSGRELVDALLDEASRFPVPPVLFPCTDLSVLAVSQYRDELASGYRMVLPEPGVIELLLDKARFQAYATEKGLPIAATAVLTSRADAERAVTELRFPCAIKPAVKTPSWVSRTSAKVYRVETPEEFLQRYDQVRHWTDRLIAQEWIDGSDTAHVTCNAYFDGNSNPHVTFVSQKLRQWPLEGGVGCLSQEFLNDEVLRETVRLFQGVGHRGLAYLEMKRDARRGHYVIIEPNVGRPTGRSAAADDAGIDLLYSQYCDALGRPLPPAREQSQGHAKWVYLRQDLQSAVQHWRQGTLTLSGWMQSLAGFRRDAVFSWSDPRPFIADIKALRQKAKNRRVVDRQQPVLAPVLGSVDFDVHGVVGIRLVDASASDIAAVVRQLGPFQKPLDRQPDITVRFVDDLPVHGLQWVEFGRTGFTEDGFYVVQSGKRPARVKLALEEVGEYPEIVCQRGLKSVPMLMAIVTITALQHGCVPLHASAFTYKGVGVLVCGWAKGGKTESLLAFSSEGAEYIGDEWILLTPDGRMLGIPEHIRLQDWHLAQLPRVRARVSAGKRAFFKSIRMLDAMHRRASRGVLARVWPTGVLNDALPPLKRQLNAQLNPAEVFERQGAFEGRLDKVFFMVSYDRPEITVEGADAAEIAERMTASVAFERLPLVSSWLAYQFAFPSRRGGLFERMHHLQQAGLSRLLAGTEAFVVRHPYPCNLRELFDAMAPSCHPAATRVTRDRRPVSQFVRRPLQVEERQS